MRNVSYLAAFGGGLVSFLSPCVLPIVPGYLSVVTGLSAAELREGSAEHLRRIALFTGLFVLGFGVVFVLLGLAASSVGRTIFRNQETLIRVSGVVMLLMALYLAGSQLLARPGLYRELRFHPRVERWGPWGIPLTGAAFGLGWTPCIGPVLGSILTVAATETSFRAGVLLAVYSVGLGVPFLVTGLLFGRLGGVLGWFKRHSVGITLGSAAVLGAFGVVLVLDGLPRVTAELSRFLEAVGLRRLVELGCSAFSAPL